MRRKYDGCGSCGCRYAIATPDEICAYLERHGWVRVRDISSNRNTSAVKTWAVYRLDGSLEIEVPLMAKALDWGRRYWQCLENIWRVEVKRGNASRTIADLASDMLTVQERIESAENEMLRYGSLATALSAESMTPPATSTRSKG